MLDTRSRTQIPFVIIINIGIRKIIEVNLSNDEEILYKKSCSIISDRFQIETLLLFDIMKYKITLT